MELDTLDQLAAGPFDGFLVRKDLVRKYARHYPVPTYVVEFLLGRYCAAKGNMRTRPHWPALHEFGECLRRIVGRA